MPNYKFQNDMFNQVRDAAKYSHKDDYSFPMLEEIYKCVGDKNGIFLSNDYKDNLKNVLEALKENNWIQDYQLDCSIDADFYDNCVAVFAVARLYDNGDLSLLNIQTRRIGLWNPDTAGEGYENSFDPDFDYEPEEEYKCCSDFDMNNIPKDLDDLDEAIEDELSQCQNEGWEDPWQSYQWMTAFLTTLKDKGNIQKFTMDTSIDPSLAAASWVCDAVAWVRADGKLHLWTSQRCNRPDED